MDLMYYFDSIIIIIIINKISTNILINLPGENINTSMYLYVIFKKNVFYKQIYLN